MGTSVSRRSPETPSWRAVRATYQTDLPIERVSREVWRAASTDPSAAWVDRLGSDTVFDCFRVASQSDGPADAVQRVTRLIVDRRDASLVSEIAKLAVAASAGRPDAGRLFMTSLFDHATDYLVARDLSGFVGARSRVRNVQEAIEFKRATREHVGATAALQSRPGSASEWRTMVRGLIDALSSADEHAR